MSATSGFPRPVVDLTRPDAFGVSICVSTSTQLTCAEEVRVPEKAIPENLRTLHAQEEFLRDRALDVVAADRRFELHVGVV